MNLGKITTAADTGDWRSVLSALESATTDELTSAIGTLQRLTELVDGQLGRRFRQES